jgi:hypothetical protein
LPVIISPYAECMITYNNVLMERRQGQKIVYMPVYQCPALDAEAAAIYSALGFRVHEIDVSGVYGEGGAIRCLTNVTARRAPGLASPWSAGTAGVPAGREEHG